jgi:hypothetical protein
LVHLVHAAAVRLAVASLPTKAPNPRVIGILLVQKARAKELRAARMRRANRAPRNPAVMSKPQRRIVRHVKI